LTTKFTQHTGVSVSIFLHIVIPSGASISRSGMDAQPSDLVSVLTFPDPPTRLVDFMGLYPALPIQVSRLRNLHLLSGKLFQALIKIYVRLVICPIYSVVKYRPRRLVQPT